MVSANTGGAARRPGWLRRRCVFVRPVSQALGAAQADKLSCCNNRPRDSVGVSQASALDAHHPKNLTGFALSKERCFHPSHTKGAGAAGFPSPTAAALGPDTGCIRPPDHGGSVIGITDDPALRRGPETCRRSSRCRRPSQHPSAPRTRERYPKQLRSYRRRPRSRKRCRSVRSMLVDISLEAVS